MDLFIIHSLRKAIAHVKPIWEGMIIIPNRLLQAQGLILLILYRQMGLNLKTIHNHLKSQLWIEGVTEWWLISHPHNITTKHKIVKTKLISK